MEKNRLTRYLFIALLLGVVSCQGYRYQTRSNPFAQYNINSVAIVQFYNKSNLARLAPAATKEFHALLGQFSDLKVYSGDVEADAVFIGIVESGRSWRDSRGSTSNRLAILPDPGPQDVERAEFYVPSNTTVSASIRAILIKKPSKKEIELLKTSLGKFALGNRVVFNELIPVSSGFGRELRSTEASSVNESQNRSAFQSSADLMAKQAANNFRDMILYAF